MKSDRFISHLVHRVSWDELDADYIKKLVETARAEDICGLGLATKPKLCADITTMSLTPNTSSQANFVARRDMVVCGMKLVETILEVYSSYSPDEAVRFEPFAKDGDKVAKGTALGRISGAARTMLQAERIMLNFLQRLSGIATETAKYVDALRGTNAKLLDTRKTTPCLRALEKYAFACGGAHNHRMGLFDRVMLKDNHLFAANAVEGETLAKAVLRARELNPDVAVEVEVDNIKQISPVLEAGADVIMFDNFTIEQLKEGVALVGDKAWTEASGGVNLTTLAEIGKTGVDFVSSGAPIHSSVWIDIGLDS